jgi:hypothetical protein
MPRPEPLTALFGQVDFSKLLPIASGSLAVNDLVCIRRAAGGPNVITTIGEIQAHGGAVDISDLTGGANDDMLYRVAGVWTGSGATGLKYNGTFMQLPVGSALQPSAVFDGATTTGFFRGPVDNIGVSILGSQRFNFAPGGLFTGANAAGPLMWDAAASSVQPTFVPNKADLNTGIGWRSADIMTLIAEGAGIADVKGGPGVRQFIVLPTIAIQNAPATPALQIGSGANGFYNPVANVISVAIAGVQRWSFQDNQINSSGSGAAIRWATPSATVPSLLPNATATADGIGRNAAGEISLIGASVELARTVTAATGGLQANNQSTGAGLERVLTTSDLPSGLFPEYLFTSKDFDNPNNADWDLNALAPAAADSNNAALTVRLFDDTTAEGVGLYFQLPTGAVSFTLEWLSRAETAPGAPADVKPAIEIREVEDNVAVPSPPWTSFNLVDTAIPTNENFQYDSQTITFASLALTAGNYVQMQFNRNPTHPNDDLAGDWVVLSVRVSFA